MDVHELQAVIGVKIRERRRRMKLTQEALAERLSLTANYVAHLERGSRGSSLGTLLTLARVFRCTPRNLLP
jgi:transcriptional regulator with XRE-family HTH domain